MQAGEDVKEVADAFNPFFQKVGSNLAGEVLKGKIGEVIGQTGMSERVSPSLFLTPVKNQETIKIIENLNNSSAPGEDRLKAEFFKRNRVTLSDPLVHLLNLTFEEGIFSQDLKEAVIRPIFKSGDSKDIGCYRPISLLNTLSKNI